MNQFAKRLIILALIVAALLALWFFTPAGELVNFRSLFENRNQLLDFVKARYGISVAVYIFVYIAATALSIPGATVLTLLGGFFFGPWLATLYINAGATLGAFIIFLAARYFLGEGIQSRYGDKLEKFNREIDRNGPNYMFTLRLIPIFPFFLVNLFAGFTTISPRRFLWTTSLGIIPGSLAYAWLGFAGATIGEGAPWQLFVALGLLAVLSLLPVLLRKVRGSGVPDQQVSEPGAGAEAPEAEQIRP
jgi:uncharacterized membrane protein YdjX (TVP38/TMEM64 family)